MGCKVYINDFCQDLNYQGIILWIGSVDSNKLLESLERDNVGKLWRFLYATSNTNPSMKDFIYVENCDLQNLDYPIYEYMEEGYDIYCLYEDSAGFYVKKRLDS